jgi:hypothetical protein
MIGHSEKIWLMLVGLTLAGAWLGESGSAGWMLTLTVAFLIGFKGHAVIDHYMEMRLANRRLRRALFIFLSLVILLVIVGYGLGENFRLLTTLS